MNASAYTEIISKHLLKSVTFLKHDRDLHISTGQRLKTHRQKNTNTARG